MNKQISILIPAYNCQQFIEKCLLSIINNTYINYAKIFIIDDCSTDNTWSLINAIVNNYPKLKEQISISKNPKNLGIGTTRQQLIELCDTKYFIFIDSDDYIENNFLEEFYNKSIQTDADIITCDYFVNCNKYQIISKQRFSKTQDENIKKLFYYKLKPFLWCKLIKKELFLNHEIEKSNNINMSEDRFILFQIILYCNKFANINTPLYHYQINSTSITAKISLSKYKDIFFVLKFIKTKYQQLNIYDKYEKDFYYIKLIQKKKFLIDFLPPLKFLKKFFSNDEINYLKENINLFDKRNKLIFFLIIKNKFYLLKIICLLINFYKYNIITKNKFSIERDNNKLNYDNFEFDF